MASSSGKSTNQPAGMDKQIDENLKRVFDDTLNEELPDRFRDLIEQLKQSDKAVSDDK